MRTPKLVQHRSLGLKDKRYASLADDLAVIVILSEQASSLCAAGNGSSRSSNFDQTMAIAAVPSWTKVLIAELLAVPAACRQVLSLSVLLGLSCFVLLVGGKNTFQQLQVLHANKQEQPITRWVW